MEEFSGIAHFYKVLSTALSAQINVLCLVLSLQDCGVGKDDLTQIELQLCVDFVNTVVQEEHDCKQNIISPPCSGEQVRFLLSPLKHRVSKRGVLKSGMPNSLELCLEKDIPSH